MAFEWFQKVHFCRKTKISIKVGTSFSHNVLILHLIKLQHIPKIKLIWITVWTFHTTHKVVAIKIAFWGILRSFSHKKFSKFHPNTSKFKVFSHYTIQFSKVQHGLQILGWNISKKINQLSSVAVFRSFFAAKEVWPLTYFLTDTIFAQENIREKMRKIRVKLLFMFFGGAIYCRAVYLSTVEGFSSNLGS